MLKEFFGEGIISKEFWPLRLQDVGVLRGILHPQISQHLKYNTANAASSVAVGNLSRDS
jgi:hypothetical protein